MLDEFGPYEEEVARLRRELEFASELVHPRLVATHGTTHTTRNRSPLVPGSSNGLGRGFWLAGYGNSR